MPICFRKHLTKIPRWFYECGHCNKIHFGNKNIDFYNHMNNKYYCKKYIIKIDNTFEWDKTISIESLEELYNNVNVNQKMKIANDILKNYGFRRLSNGESIYTKIYDVLRIEDDIIFLNVNDEYYDIMDVKQDYMFIVYKNRYLHDAEDNTKQGDKINVKIS